MPGGKEGKTLLLKNLPDAYTYCRLTESEEGYKKAMSKEEIAVEFKTCAGSQLTLSW